jgi:hypothetical protein
MIQLSEFFGKSLSYRKNFPRSNLLLFSQEPSRLRSPKSHDSSEALSFNIYDANLLGSVLCQWRDFGLSGLWEPFMDVSSRHSILFLLLV